MQQMIFIADFIACSTCFGHHYAHHQELESIIQMVPAYRIWCWFSSCRYGVELRVMCPGYVSVLCVRVMCPGYVSGLQAAAAAAARKPDT